MGREEMYNPAIPIETFDFIFTDECHRSIYNLWRGVLEYFDAFRAGMANRATFVVDKEGKISYIEEGNTAVDPTGAEQACSRTAHKGAEEKK